MRTRVHLHVDAKLVAAYHSTRRMHEIDVARIAFGIEGALDDERPDMAALDEARAPVRSGPFCWQMGSDPKSEMKLGAPSG
jgi:hypothetical protein